MLNYYKIYKITGLNPPNNVLKYTQHYKYVNDYYSEYVSKYLEKNENSFIIWTELKDSFVEWYYENKGSTIPQMKCIKEYFENKVFLEEEKHKSVKNVKYRGWSGWLLKKEIKY